MTYKTQEPVYNHSLGILVGNTHQPFVEYALGNIPLVRDGQALRRKDKTPFAILSAAGYHPVSTVPLEVRSRKDFLEAVLKNIILTL